MAIFITQEVSVTIWKHDKDKKKCLMECSERIIAIWYSYI